MKKPLLLIAILACCVVACNTRKCQDLPDPESGNEYFGARSSCPDGNPCSYNLVYVTAQVVDVAGAPVSLDSFVVTNRAGVPVPPNANGQQVWGAAELRNGYYTVLNDGWVAGHEGLGSHFVAKGFRNDTMVFSETYKISADCCHINKISGPERIVIP